MFCVCSIPIRLFYNTASVSLYSVHVKHKNTATLKKLHTDCRNCICSCNNKGLITLHLSTQYIHIYFTRYSIIIALLGLFSQLKLADMREIEHVIIFLKCRIYMLEAHKLVHIQFNFFQMLQETPNKMVNIKTKKVFF